MLSTGLELVHPGVIAVEGLTPLPEQVPARAVLGIRGGHPLIPNHRQLLTILVYWAVSHLFDTESIFSSMWATFVGPQHSAANSACTFERKNR